MDGKENGLMLRNMKMKPLSAWNSIRLLSSIRSANKSYRKSAPAIRVACLSLADPCSHHEY
jgi:hypothetical protein